MRTGFRVVLVALACVCGRQAVAQEWYTGSGENKSVSNFGAAIDASLTGTTKKSEHGGLIGTIAPFSKLEESGARLRLGGILGDYTYVSASPGVGTVVGHETAGSVLGGYEWTTPGTSVAVYLGGELQNRTLSKPDPSNKITGTRVGFKASVDFNVNPTSYTMASGNITYSSNNNAYYTRFKAGLAITERIFVGPEMLFLGDNFYKQWRAGVHLTGARLGPMQFGVSGGYLNDRDQGSGAYGILDARVSF